MKAAVLLIIDFTTGLVNGAFDARKQPVMPHDELVIITQFSPDDTAIEGNITYIFSVSDYRDLEFASDILSPTLTAMQVEPLGQTLAACLYNPNKTGPIKCSNKGLFAENVSPRYVEYIHHNVTYDGPEEVLSKCTRPVDLLENT